MGLNFKFFDEQVWITPYLGFTNGDLIHNNLGDAVVKGIVPTIEAGFETDRFECDIYAAHYRSLKGKKEDVFNYYQLWIIPGIVLTKHFGAGMYYEQYFTSGNTDKDAYTWLGGYFKYVTENKYSIMLSCGKNFVQDYYSPLFYKLALHIPF